MRENEIYVLTSNPEITETPGWLSYESSKKGTWLRYDKQEDIPTTYGGKKIF